VQRTGWLLSNLDYISIKMKKIKEKIIHVVRCKYTILLFALHLPHLVFLSFLLFWVGFFFFLIFHFISSLGLWATPLCFSDSRLSCCWHCCFHCCSKTYDRYPQLASVSRQTTSYPFTYSIKTLQQYAFISHLQSFVHSCNTFHLYVL